MVPAYEAELRFADGRVKSFFTYRNARDIWLQYTSCGVQVELVRL